MPDTDTDISERVSRFKFSQFDAKTEDWRYYMQRFELELSLQNLSGNSDAQKIAKRNLLLKSVGAELYRLVVDHFDPKDISQITFDDIKTFLNDFYRPTTSYLAERMKFGQTMRKNDQSVSHYISELRSLAVGCKFAATLEERIRDQFLLGLRNPSMQEELFRNHPEDNAKLADIEKTALIIESAQRQRKSLEFSGESNDYHNQTIHKVQKFSKKFNKSVSGQDTQNKFANSSVNNNNKKFTLDAKFNCMRCGRDKHTENENCPAKNSTCRACGILGHWQLVCLKTGQATNGNKNRRGSRINCVSTHASTQAKLIGLANREGALRSSDTQNTMTYSMSDELSVNRVSKNKPRRYMLDVTINGLPLKMEYDTAAQRTVISKMTWLHIGQPSLVATENLGAYPNFSIEMLGEGIVNVKLGKTVKKLPVAVTKHTGMPLFRQDWIEAFDLEPRCKFVKLTDINACKIMKTSDSKIDNEIKSLLNEYSDVVSDKQGLIKNYQAKIQLENSAIPTVFKPRPVPFAIKPAADAEIDRLVKTGILEPVDPAVTPIEWASPVVYVPKPDGRIRLCGDFKVTVNWYIHPNPHPLPRFGEMVAKLSGFTEFSTIDLKDAYLQMEISPESRKYLVIATHKGHFQFTRLPFGISSAPGIFQKFMDTLFQGMEGVTWFMDDICTGGKTREEHVLNIRKVLSRLRQVGLHTQSTKLKLLQTEVKFLGHIIDRNGIHPTEENLRALRDQPKPENVSELRSFLGSLNYYARFIPNLQSKCASLHRLLQKNVRWTWTSNDTRIFTQLKMAISSKNVLVHFDPNLPVILATDAFEKGLGAILMHRYPDGSDKPIAAASRSLTKTESRYAPIDREALAIMFGVSKFHQYLYGRKFTLKTDHKPLERIFGENKEIPKMAASRLTRWAISLSAYTYKIEYSPGKDNTAADALSRLPLPESVASELECSDAKAVCQIREMQIRDLPLTRNLLKRKTLQDNILNTVVSYLQRGWPEKHRLHADVHAYHDKRNELSYEDNTVMWQNRIVVPKLLQIQVLNKMHESHSGIVAMKSLARTSVWWPNINSEIEKLVNSCKMCQENRKREPETPLNSWNIPDHAWERIHVDFAGPFQDHMWFVIVDAYSRWVEIFPMKNATTTKILQILESLFSKYGICKYLVSDNGSQFTSQEFKNFCNSKNVIHIKSTPYHSRTNGLAERAIQNFKRHYNIMKLDQYPTLIERLNTWLFTYRCTQHSCTNRTPAELFLSRKLCTVFDRLKPDVKSNMLTAQAKQKLYHDRHSKTRDFYLGDTVWVYDVLRKNWSEGKIKRQTGPLSYTVTVDGVDQRKHADHLRSRHDSANEPDRQSHTLVQVDSTTPTADADPAEQVDTATSAVEEFGQQEDGEEIDRDEMVRDETPQATLRRSSRVCRPPQRYGQ